MTEFLWRGSYLNPERAKTYFLEIRGNSRFEDANAPRDAMYWQRVANGVLGGVTVRYNDNGDFEHATTVKYRSKLQEIASQFELTHMFFFEVIDLHHEAREIEEDQSEIDTHQRRSIDAYRTLSEEMMAGAFVLQGLRNGHNTHGEEMWLSDREGNRIDE